MATRKPTPPHKASTSKRGPRPHEAADARQVALRLERAIPSAECELRHRNAFELLIATILSAQSTDKTVNAVTPELFARWPNARALADAPQEEVEEVVKRTGFFRNKAKSIRGASQKLVDLHHGEVPRSLEQLVELPGVARKTANVVLGTAYRIAAGFVVDTHVARVAQRLALSAAEEPVKIERDLCAAFPQDSWIDTGHRVLLHGRYTCLAKAPMCAVCPLNELCPQRQAAPELSWQERADQEAQRARTGMAG